MLLVLTLAKNEGDGQCLPFFCFLGKRKFYSVRTNSDGIGLELNILWQKFFSFPLLLGYLEFQLSVF